MARARVHGRVPWWEEDDLTQDVALRVHLRVQRGPPVNDLEAYVGKSAINQCCLWWRRRKRRPKMQPLDGVSERDEPVLDERDPPAPAATPACGVKLTALQQRVAELRYVQRRSLRAIGQALGKPKCQIQAILRRLRCLAPALAGAV